jgi:hypothetical protein
LRKVAMKYDGLIVFIRLDSADIWGFRYGLTFGSGTIRIMARTGVFVIVVCALKHSNNGHRRKPRMILTYIKHKQSRSYQQNDLQGWLVPNKISGVGTSFGLLVHVHPGPNKLRARKPSILLS